MRQVSFTLLMTGRRHGNSVQYERNRRFGTAVRVLGRKAGGARLPSVGIRLNASKPESAPAGTSIVVGARLLQRLVRELRANTLQRFAVVWDPVAGRRTSYFH